MDYFHDLNGSRTVERPPTVPSGGTRLYYYNALGEMTGTTAYDGDIWIGGPEWCRYDAVGRRVYACDNGATQGLAAFDGDNVVRINNWRYVHGPGVDDPLVAVNYSQSAWVKYFYLTDGSRRLLVFTDTLGRSMTNELVYTQNGGNQAGEVNRATTYANSRTETPQAASLSFYRNRYYDQNTGRWTQEDPIGIAGGANLYSYVGNNPALHTDPFGLCAKLQEQADDTTQTRYADLSKRCVEEGDSVQQGDLIGYTGATGSGQPHLHFEVCRITSGNGVKKGSCERVEPLGYLAANGGTNPLETVTVTSPFGPRNLDGFQQVHQGVDLRARTPQPVYAAFSGRVSFSGRAKGYGEVIYINH